MSLKCEPASEPQHISVEWLFLNCGIAGVTRYRPGRSRRASRQIASPAGVGRGFANPSTLECETAKLLCPNELRKVSGGRFGPEIGLMVSGDLPGTDQAVAVARFVQLRVLLREGG